MNFIQTLYISSSKHPFKHSFGWATPQYHLMGWALSYLQLNKLYGTVELYANSNAAKLLIDTLDLPYSKVHVTHDSLVLINENLWALPKTFTYSLQKEPGVLSHWNIYAINLNMAKKGFPCSGWRMLQKVLG